MESNHTIDNKLRTFFPSVDDQIIAKAIIIFMQRDLKKEKHPTGYKGLKYKIIINAIKNKFDSSNTTYSTEEIEEVFGVLHNNNVYHTTDSGKALHNQHYSLNKSYRDLK
jgi:hypothetical protein